MVEVGFNSLPNLINRHSPASPLRKLEMGILKSGAVYHHRYGELGETGLCLCMSVEEMGVEISVAQHKVRFFHRKEDPCTHTHTHIGWNHIAFLVH